MLHLIYQVTFEPSILVSALWIRLDLSYIFTYFFIVCLANARKYAKFLAYVMVVSNGNIDGSQKRGRPHFGRLEKKLVLG